MNTNQQMTLRQCKFFMSLNSALRVVPDTVVNTSLRKEFIQDAVNVLKKMDNSELAELSLRRHR